MTEQTRAGGDELDLATIARDDQLLDALSRGEPGPAGDDVAALLAAWRSDVDGDREQRLIRAGGEARPPVPAAGPPPVTRGALRLAAAVVTLLVIATGLGVGSRHAGPTSPLWSLTRVLYPEQAQVRGVEDSIARARDAVAAGQLDEARHLIEQAHRELAGVTDPAVVARLRAELDALDRELLAALPAPPPAPVPSAGAPTPRPSTAVPRPSDSGAPTPSAPGPAPSSGGPGLPGLLPLPPLPLPTSDPDSDPPTLPLPSLPVLPLPTGIPLG
ncbi:anti-sigma-D factor RsdA [Micromonospora sp. NPDC051006]|uniref:anti-sigma-D factor RsdA n=1 Tax=Micromonospora sp. NPDC051006 TaxID=3364283 RepID=UPI0037892913